MKRLMFGLTTLLLSGCIYLTPPTGLRLGDHGQEFANAPAGPSVQQIAFQAYKASDFSILYPTPLWGVGATEQPAGTSAVNRVAIGVRSTDPTTNQPWAEGVIVTTVTADLGSDPAKANQTLAGIVHDNLASSYKNFSVLHQTADPLGGEPGMRLEATGMDSNGGATHVLAESAVHDGKGYILVIFTIETRFSTYQPVYDAVLDHFAFIPPVGGTASGTASPASSASATASATAAPSPKASATPSP